MGDNAKQEWSWHNNEIGQGYQAKGVVRQKHHGDNLPMKVIDMSVSVSSNSNSNSKKRLYDNDDDDNNEEDDNNKKKKHKSKSHKKQSKKEKSKKHSKKHKKEKSKKGHKKEKGDHNDKDDNRCNFNPLLQLLGILLYNLFLFKNIIFIIIIIFIATRLSNTTRHFSCEGWP